LVLTACSSDEERAPAIGDCSGFGCGTSGGTGGPTDAGTDVVSEGGDVSDTGDGPQVADLVGQVVLLTDDGFQESQPWSGWGNLRVQTASGDEVVPFGTDAGAGFAASGVLAGDNWFAVVPSAVFLDAGASYVAVMPTYAYLRVPADGSTSFDVPLIDGNVLSMLYATLPTPTFMRADAAQVVVVFEREGKRESGVSITSWPTADLIAYDEGVGFSMEATETGLQGVAVLANVVGAGPLMWEASGGAKGTLTVVHVPGQASFVRIEVPPV
jgi:hypothetical protein